MLEIVALSKLDPAIEPDESFAEDIGTFDFTDKAAPFKPTASMFKMDDSGAERGLDNRFFDSLKRFDQSFLADTFLSDTDPNSLMYPPAQPGDYVYEGNMFTLNPDGTMVSEAGIPVDDAGKARILAANLPKVPIPNYGEKDELPPGAIVQDFASLIADQSDGTPVEPLDINNLPESIIQARKMSAPELDPTGGVPSNMIGGFGGDMTPSSVVPTRVDVPIEGTERPPALDRYPEPVIPELPDLSDVEEKNLKDEISAYLAGDTGRYQHPGFLEKRDLLNQGLAFDGSRGYLPNEILSSERDPMRPDLMSDLEYAQMKLRQREKLNMYDVEGAEADGVLFDGSIEDKLKYDGPMARYLEGAATKYYQDDQYTPPEEIYSGDPREIAKYQGASDEEIQAISDRLAVEADEAEAKKIADTATRRDVEEDLATEDAAAFLALNQPPEAPTFMEQVSRLLQQDKKTQMKDELIEKN